MAMSGWGIFFAIVIVLIILAAIGWTVFTHLRARRLGLPPPSLNPFSSSHRRRRDTSYTAPAPAPGGIRGWLSTRFRNLRNSRTAGGAYESTGPGYAGAAARGRRGFGALDPDEAWDARVGNEAYYEEQELGLQDAGAAAQGGPYGGRGYEGVGAAQGIGVAGIEEGRGRSRSRQRVLDERYEEEVHHAGQNPFGDQAERSNVSLRGVSPRPVADGMAGEGGSRGHRAGQPSLGPPEDSPTERRSMFRENM
ncbi:hypothetical protein LTR50_000221 [Elasticomyces elasticus]|nr:hypothetical protein LTR50_000221 [Elasticomyces elasticus]